MPKRVYISGPITTAPDTYKKDFADAAARLRAAYYSVMCPVEQNNDDPSYEWIDFMRDDLRLLLQCDIIAVLPNWIHSPGARVEVAMALGLKMPIMDAVTLKYLNLDVWHEFEDPTSKLWGISR